MGKCRAGCKATPQHSVHKKPLSPRRSARKIPEVLEDIIAIGFEPRVAQQKQDYNLIRVHEK